MLLMLHMITSWIFYHKFALKVLEYSNEEFCVSSGVIEDKFTLNHFDTLYFGLTPVFIPPAFMPTGK